MKHITIEFYYYLILSNDAPNEYYICSYEYEME